MLMKLFLLCVAVFLAKVTGNPLLQALQTCPICQPNVANNPLASLPLMLSNIQPCPQQFTNQNPLQQTVFNTLQNQCLCQPQGLPQNQFNPGLFNKVLSNPTLRSILDPNTRLFNQNGVEVPRNGPCNGAPNVVNNYIIVPPEFLIEDQCKKKDDKKIPDRREVNRINQSDRRRQKEGSEKGDNKRNTPNSEKTAERRKGRKEVTGNKTDNGVERERKQRRRPKNRNSDVKVKVLNETSIQDNNNRIESPKPILDDDKVTKEITDNGVASKGVNSLNESAVFQNEAPSVKENTLIPVELSNNTIENIGDENSKYVPKQTGALPKETAEYKMNINDGRTVTQKPKRRKKPFNNNVTSNVMRGNTREEAAIHDFCQKFPNIPEDVVRHLLDHMKRQLQKEQLVIPTYYPQFPINYDQLYKSPIANNSPSSNSNRGQNRSSKRRNNRRNRKRKPKNQACDESTTIVELTPTLEKHYETTTEKQPAIEDVTVAPDITEAEVETATPVVKDKESLEIITADRMDAKTPDLGSEDVVPMIYVNGLVDDYYPDFTSDNQYYSNEDVSFLKFEDDRYHYTTDKNYELEELNRERRKLETFDNDRDKVVFKIRDKGRSRNRAETTPRFRFDIDTERPRLRLKLKNERKRIPSREKEEKKEAIEQNTVMPEVIEFRTPPSLEKIDFETKPIDKNFYFHEDLDKIVGFSDVKTPQFNVEEKKVKIATQVNKNDEIETVYARSKVVTYGQPVSEESLKVVTENDDDTYNSFEDKTVVVGKQMDHFW